MDWRSLDNLRQQVWSRNDATVSRILCNGDIKWRYKMHFMESDNDAKCIVVKTNDTDVVVLFLTFFEQFFQHIGQADFWIDFGLGDYRRFI